MQQKSEQKPPNIASSLNKAFLQKQNTLVLHSKGLDILRALANSLYLQKNHLVILVDFEYTQIQQLNYYLQDIKQQRLILKDDIRTDKPEVIFLSKVIRDKRKKHYISGGIYALSTQIVLLDCLSDTEDLNPQYISRLIFKDSDYVINSKFSLLSWLATLISLQRNKTLITFISRRASQFKGQNLQKIMRLLYIKRPVLWPFGRSEIHQSLSRKSLNNRNHKLNLNSAESQIHNQLIQLMKYTQKSVNEKKQVEYLCYCLLNYNKLDFLVRLEDVVINSGQYSIWKSSNTNIIELIDRIIQRTRKCVYNMLLVKNNQLPANLPENEYKQKQQQGQQFCQREANCVNKIRQIDLNKLIVVHEPIIKKQFPTQLVTQKDSNSETIQGQKQIKIENNKMNPAWHELFYELHITGLNNIELDSSPIFSAKLLEILKQLRANCRKPKPKDQKNEEEINVEQMVCLLNQIRESNQPIKKEQEFTTIKSDREKEFEKKQNIQMVNDIDLSSYQFGQQTKQTKKINQEPSITEKVMSTYPIKQQLQNRIIQNHRMSQNEIVACLCTNSKQINKYLHYSMFCYQNQFHYIAYIRKLCAYLEIKSEERVNAIKRIIKRLSNPTSKSTKPLVLEQEPILLQQLYLQLRTVNQLVQRYSALRHDTVQADYLFWKQIDRLDLRYVNKSGLKLWNHDFGVFDDCLVYFGVNNEWKIRFCFLSNSNLAQLNQNLRILAPQYLFFYTPNTSFIRHLNIAYSQDTLIGLQQLHNIYFNNSLQAENVVKSVKEQDEAFWNVAQERKKLAQYIQSPEVRIKQLIIDDQIQKKAKMINLAAATQAKVSQHGTEIRNLSMSVARVQRVVLVDKRQFKSLLPSYLFHHGFKVIPVFLQNADYILSNEVAIQKKSVHTRDLHESLRSGRLIEQMRRMCAKFSRPYLLIECPDSSYFKREQFSYGYSRVTGDKYFLNIRKQIIQVLYRFPKMNLIWSTNYMETIKYFIELKKNREEPDIGKFKPQSEDNELEVLEQEEEQNQNIYPKIDIVL